MATYRFDPSEPRLVVPAGATEREAAAIAAAIERALAAEGADADEPAVDPWRRAARLEAVGGRSTRRAARHPDPWRAASRW